MIKISHEVDKKRIGASSVDNLEAVSNAAYLDYFDEHAKIRAANINSGPACQTSPTPRSTDLVTLHI